MHQVNDKVCILTVKPFTSINVAVKLRMVIFYKLKTAFIQNLDTGKLCFVLILNINILYRNQVYNFIKKNV